MIIYRRMLRAETTCEYGAHCSLSGASHLTMDRDDLESAFKGDFDVERDLLSVRLSENTSPWITLSKVLND